VASSIEEPRSKDTLDGTTSSRLSNTSFGDLVSPALLANGLICAGLLFEKRLFLALSVASGWGVALLIYATLNAVIDRTFSSLLNGPRQEFIKSPANRFMLGALVAGKFIVVGALLYVLFELLHVSVGAFTVGFVVTQIVVSIGVYQKMKKSKITE
jgi:hypothetical protein